MKKFIFIIAITGLIPFFSTCEDWFDVDPRSQVKSDVLFEDEKGFRTALFGLYTSMGQSSLYGGELTMSLLDVLGQYYTITSTNHNYYELSKYTYDVSKAKNKISSVWNGMYRVIMNCNNLLENIEGKEALFEGENYRLIRGEVLGIRAYLHFDLLRMFAPSYAVGQSEPAIPYVDRVVRVPFPQLTHEQVIARILEDCKAALADLEVSDPFGPAGIVPDDDDDFLQNRYERMNYYAVKALTARVYLWCNNLQEAGRIAGELVKSPSTQEVTQPLFALYSHKLSDLSNTFFGENAQEYNKLVLSTAQKTEFYPKGFSDTRDKWLELQSGDLEGSSSASYLVKRYVQGVIQPTWITLLGMTEMYYIQAECREDAGDALEDLNTVRHAYNIPEAQDLTETAIFEEELMKEYRKTFLAEGQFFYFLKRRDVATIPGTLGIDNPRTVFCLPLPDDELEFGNLITKNEEQ